MSSSARFYVLADRLLDGLSVAAQPQRVTEGFLFFARTYEVDRFDEFLEQDGRELPPAVEHALEPASTVLLSALLVLRQTLDLDLQARQHRTLADGLTGPGRQVLVFGRSHAQDVLQRWPAGSPDVGDVWAVLTDHGFAASQRAYATGVRDALTTVRVWLESVGWDETGVLVVT